MPADYTSTARALAISPSPSPSPSPTLSADNRRPPWSRPRTSSSLRLATALNRAAGAPSSSPKPLSERILTTVRTTNLVLLRAFLRLTPLQRVLVAIASLASIALSITFLIYSSRIFTALGPVAQSWRELPGGWLIIWVVVFLCAFPPMIGYSTANAVAGFVFGFPWGWPIVATASTAGSLAAFVASRTVLSAYVHRLVGRDHRFMALGQVLKKEGVGMLTMIRFCPLPYSLSNGFLATIPSIGPVPFALSTALASPKLLVHIFIGSRLALLVEEGDTMSAGAKAVNYISMFLGGIVGVTVGWLIYRRTMARAAEIALETAAEEGLVSSRPGTPLSPRLPGIAEGLFGLDGNGGGYADGEAGARLLDPEDAAAVLGDDDISLWETAAWDEYRDEDAGPGSASGNGVKGQNGRGS